jgi:hypothetical protein
LADVSSWLVLVYMAANNSLSGEVDAAFDQMKSAALQSGVTVIVEVIRPTPKGSSSPQPPPPGVATSNGNDGVMTRYLLTGNGGATELMSKDGVDSGVPGELKCFLDWATSTYATAPINVALAVWSHGSGVIDWGSQDSNPAPHVKASPASNWILASGDVCAIGMSGSDYLTTQQFASELATSAYCQAKNSFALVLFDACFMSMLEIGYQLQSSATGGSATALYLAGSEWEMGSDAPGGPPGLPYAQILSGLSGSQAPLDFVESIVGTYETKAAASSSVVVFAGLDLVALATFASTYETLVEVMAVLAQSAAGKQAVQSAAAAAHPFYGYFIDARAFLNALPASDEADECIAALAKVLAPGFFTTNEDYGGVSIFYPNHALAESTWATYQSLFFPTDTGWGALLANQVVGTSDADRPIFVCEESAPTELPM